MGCASSKSTPVVDSISSGTNDLKEASNGLLKKGKEAVKGVADEVCEVGNNVSHKIGSLTDKLVSSQPNSPETERAQMGAEDDDEDCEHDDVEVEGSPKVPVKILSIDLDEDNKNQLRDNQLPVKVSLSIGDSDNEAGGEKPPTPMPEDDCLNRGGGNRNACTCDDDESESETCFDTMRTRKSQDDDDACCANSIELNFNEEGDDCTNQQNTLCSIDCQSEDDCATDNQDCGADVCESEDDACAQSTCNDCDNDDEDTCECDQEENCADDDACAAEDNECECEEADNCADDNNCTDNNDCGNDDCENNDNCNNDNCGDNEFDNNNCGTEDSTDDNCAGDDCAEDNCEENETDICADNDECAADKSEDLCQTNTGTLQSECSYRSEDGNSCLGGGSTMKCANCASAANQCNTNTIESAKSAQCNCAGDTGTLQSECSQGGCACGTMCSSYSCASEDSCAGNALCSGCANQMGTMKSNYSQSTVRSNSFECLNVAGDTDQSMANTWGKTDSFRPAQCGSSNQQGSCLVCMGTGTVRSRSAYADTMDSSYSQQYGNCAMESTRSNYAPRTGTIRSQGSDSESDSEGDAKRSPPCFNICSCLGQTLIQL